MTKITELWKNLKFVSNSENLSPEDIKALVPILEEECRQRKCRRIQSLLNRSGIKRIKCLEDFDWKMSPKLPREAFLEFAKSPWVRQTKNLVLVGPAGVGKTHLATSLCYQAIQEGETAVFISCFDLVGKLKHSRNKHALIQYYAGVRALCLDELGYVFPSAEEANDIFQIISKRSEIASTIVTTNLVPSQWGKIFDPATATAILDRLNLKGTFLTLEGKSYRQPKN
jgi:DNA replication protein DnaC